VLAWLPLPDRHISMVWSVPDSRAETLLGLDDAAMVAMVGAAGDHRWGDLRLVSRPHSFALRRQRAQRLVGPRLALVGDAAHVVHPLAGQGLNLGLRDVRELLAATRSARDPGEARLLNRYQALRQHDVRAIECLTDGLFRLFKSPLAGYLGGQGLSLLNHVSPIKSQLVKLALR
jgi:2-octaprenylphenol hydroxylase